MARGRRATFNNVQLNAFQILQGLADSVKEKEKAKKKAAKAKKREAMLVGQYQYLKERQYIGQSKETGEPGQLHNLKPTDVLQRVLRLVLQYEQPIQKVRTETVNHKDGKNAPDWVVDWFLSQAPRETVTAAFAQLCEGLTREEKEELFPGMFREQKAA